MPENNKDSALVFLCNYLKINFYETVANGDSFNDLEMITLAGSGKATANEDNKLKKAADEVVLVNDDNRPAFNLANVFLGAQESIVNKWPNMFLFLQSHQRKNLSRQLELFKVLYF